MTRCAHCPPRPVSPTLGREYPPVIRKARGRVTEAQDYEREAFHVLHGGGMPYSRPADLVSRTAREYVECSEHAWASAVMHLLSWGLR